MSTWAVEFSARARKQIRKLDRPIAQRIIIELEKLEKSERPQVHCKPLTGDRSGLWRYRAGDYRVSLDFDRGQLVILALEIAHRSTVYRK